MELIKNEIVSYTKFFKIIFILLFFVFINTYVFADIIKLKDGTIIQGKVVGEDENVIFFTSSYGTFEVRKVKQEKVHITKSYEEDIKFMNEYNLEIEPELAKKNYELGERKKMIMAMTEKKNKKKGMREYFEYWDYGRLSISVAYFATISEEVAGNSTINNRLPSGFSGHLAYEQGLDMILYLIPKSKKDNKDVSTRKFIKTKARPLFMPGLRLEWSFMYFTKDLFVNNDKEVSGSLATIGPMWSFPSPHNVWGCFMLAVMPGVSFIRVTNRSTDMSRDGQTFAISAIFGYEYAIKQKVALLFHVRYTYIKDQQISFHGIGGSFGLSIRLW